MDKPRVAAVWCRVATHDRSELSLDSQEKTVRPVLGLQGFEISTQCVLQVEWTKLDLLACPQFRQLRQWIGSGQVRDDDVTEG